MAHRNYYKILREHGFEFYRENGKHEVWTDGTTKIPVPRSGKEHRGMELQIRKLCRDAVKKRTPTLVLVDAKIEENDMQHPFANLGTTLKATTADKPPREVPVEKPTPVARSSEDCWAIVRPMRDAGATGEKICETLFDMGYLSPTGKVWTPANLYNLVNAMRAKERPSTDAVAQATATLEPEKPVQPPAVNHVPPQPVHVPTVATVSMGGAASTQAKPKPTLDTVFGDIKKLMDTDFSEEFKVTALIQLVEKLK